MKGGSESDAGKAAPDEHSTRGTQVVVAPAVEPPAVPRMEGPRPAFATVAQLGAFLKQPVGEVFGTASAWIRRRRDERLAVNADVARAILDTITSATGRATATLPRVLVVVAHPDDEAIGAGALMRGLPDVSVVHVTNGAPDDVDYARARGFPSPEAYALTRRREVLNALRLIGVPPERVRGLGIADGEAAWHLVDLCHRLADVLEEVQPEVVLTHPYEGGHSDHDSTAFAVHLAVGILRREGRPSPVIVELTSYHNYEGRRRLFEFLPFGGTVVRTVELSPEEREAKQRMFEAFTSQQRLLETIPIRVERFRSAPRYLFTVPPHEGQLDYERLCRKLTGDEWRAEAEKALAALRSKKLYTLSA